MIHLAKNPPITAPRKARAKEHKHCMLPHMLQQVVGSAHLELGEAKWHAATADLIVWFINDRRSQGPRWSADLRLYKIGIIHEGNKPSRDGDFRCFEMAGHFNSCNFSCFSWNPRPEPRAQLQAMPPTFPLNNNPHPHLGRSFQLVSSWPRANYPHELQGGQNNTINYNPQVMGWSKQRQPQPPPAIFPPHLSHKRWWSLQSSLHLPYLPAGPWQKQPRPVAINLAVHRPRDPGFHGGPKNWEKNNVFVFLRNWEIEVGENVETLDLMATSFI